MSRTTDIKYGYQPKGTVNSDEFKPPSSTADPQTVIGNIQFNNLTYLLGWKCPDCGTVWSPYVESCRNCSAPAVVYAGGTNIKTIKE